MMTNGSREYMSAGNPVALFDLFAHKTEGRFIIYDMTSRINSER